VSRQAAAQQRGAHSARVHEARVLQPRAGAGAASGGLERLVEAV